MRIGLAMILAALPMFGTPLDDGFRHMYNLRFAEAHATFQGYEKTHPADPLGPVSDAAAYLFHEFERLRILQAEFFVEKDTLHDYVKPVADPALKANFEQALERGRVRSAAMLAKNPNDPDGLFAESMRLGLHADYLALIEKRNISSLNQIKLGREIAEKLVAAHPSYFDAYLAIGLENYLLSMKPAAVRWLLRMGGAQTDRDTGIDKLKLTAENGRYLQPYARLLLAIADLRDKRPADAKKKLLWLTSEFPDNPLYRNELAKLK